MRRLASLAVLVALLACDRTDTRTTSADTARDSAAAAPDTSAAALAGSLSDTLLPLAPARRAPSHLAIDSTVKPATAVGSNQPVTPLCATGLHDPASGVKLQIVRSFQQSFKPTGSADSTVWGRADYKPSDPSRFGLAPNQVLRVDCGTRRVLGIAPDIGSVPAATRI